MKTIVFRHRNVREGITLRGVCRICGCTDDHACMTRFGPCWWVDDDHTLCSACAELQQYKKVRCLKKGFSNFVFGKVYDAFPRFTTIEGENTDYFIKDEDGDYYPITEVLDNKLEHGWEWV
ncbi:hypothetical protein J9303_00380 [Bacillaceae bacterium Marseille-Q3522]|nr:hypothetical protein [Bacillaceae bacterium Marseille-Q3522]